MASANRAGESGRRQALPVVLATVVGSSGRWSGAQAGGLVLVPVVWCSEVVWCSKVVGCLEVV
jgi:hypothetical protein